MGMHNHNLILFLPGRDLARERRQALGDCKGDNDAQTAKISAYATTRRIKRRWRTSDGRRTALGQSKGRRLYTDPARRQHLAGAGRRVGGLIKRRRAESALGRSGRLIETNRRHPAADAREPAYTA